MRRTLESKQESIRLRQQQQTRPGRRSKQSEPPAYDHEQLRRLVAAHCLLERGWSLPRVAAHFGIPIDALRTWNDNGRPLIDLRRIARKALSL
jgi:hypothetical protein